MQPASDKTAALLRENWQRVCDDVAQACHAAGRAADQVQVAGVTKYVGPELAWQLYQAGCHILAENRPQSLWEKADYFAQQMLVNRDDSPSDRCAAEDVEVVAEDTSGSSRKDFQWPLKTPLVQWHLIGHLQRNKLKRTLPIISLLHSLDSLRLAEAVNAEAGSAGRRCRVLLEVNVTQDASKTGVSIEQVRSILKLTNELPSLEFCGLMAMSSLEANENDARREFESVRELRDQLQREFASQVSLTELSMGMSGDFRAAIAAGATLVRIGSSLWQGVL